MLIIDENEMRQSVNAVDLMDAVEEAFRIMSQGDHFMPERFVAQADANKNALHALLCRRKNWNQNIISIS